MPYMLDSLSTLLDLIEEILGYLASVVGMDQAERVETTSLSVA